MNIVKKRSMEQLSLDMANASALVKLTCGVTNNATWLIMGNAHDAIKSHPRYKHEVKRLFKQAFEEFKKNERTLLYSRENRMFHVADMLPEERKRYGDITDAQYFEYWQGLGTKAYMESKKWVSSLENKYRLSLDRHGVQNSLPLSKVMAAQACIELSCSMYDDVIATCISNYNVPYKFINGLFKPFSLRNVSPVWYKAMCALDPSVEAYMLEDDEEKNIELGIIQLQEVWGNPQLMYDSMLDTVKDFEDIFRTKGENKKSQKEIREMIKYVEKYD